MSARSRGNSTGRGNDPGRVRRTRSASAPIPLRPHDALPVRPIRIVALGGGTGLSLLLRGLARLGPAVDITAVVAVSDDGGSSGRLRREMPLPAVGDARACLSALSCNTWSELLEHRFHRGEALRGHAAGNLLIAAACERLGSLEAALASVGRLVGLRGRVLPSSDAMPTLVAHLSDGTVVRGQSVLSGLDGPVERVELHPPLVPPADGVVDAVTEADLVVLGPGSLFSSVIASALPAGIARALCDTAAPRIFVQNLTAQRGETDGMDVVEHVCAVREHLGLRAIDTVLTHRWKGPPPPQGLVADSRAIRELGLEHVTARLATDEGRGRLHDPRRLARAIWRIANASGGHEGLRLVSH